MTVSPQPRRSLLRDRKRSGKPGPRCWPALESIEDRTLLSGLALTVTSLGDAGAGSGTTGDLRYVFDQANANPESIIQFSETGTITLSSALPELEADVTIEGPGADMLTLDGGASPGLTIDNGVTATISGLTFTDFGLGNPGGAISNDGQLDLSDSTFSGNTGASGGALYNLGTMRVNDCTLSGNQGSTGGAVMNAGDLAIAGSTVSGNSADSGGAIESSGLLRVVNSTIAGNTATGGAGGIDIDVGSVTPTLINTTITGNRGGTTGGVNNASGTPVALFNTLIAGNFTGPVGTLPGDFQGSVAPLSASNLIGAGNAGGPVGISNGVQGNQIGTTVNPIDPGLGALGFYGGETETIPLLEASPAIDAGNSADALDPLTNQPLEFDQRDPLYQRIVNGTVDIGAYELQPIATQLNVPSTFARYGGSTTLSAVLTQNGLPLSNEPVDFHVGSQDLGVTMTDSLGRAMLSHVPIGSLNAGPELDLGNVCGRLPLRRVIGRRRTCGHPPRR